jgi:hypothetical protein
MRDIASGAEALLLLQNFLYGLKARTLQPILLLFLAFATNTCRLFAWAPVFPFDVGSSCASGVIHGVPAGHQAVIHQAAMGDLRPGTGPWNALVRGETLPQGLKPSCYCRVFCTG